MGRRKRYGRRRKKSDSQEDARFELFGWIVFCAVLATAFVGFFLWGFLTQCVFEWPIRWDVGICWNEQVEPAQEGAWNAADDFLPRLRRP